MQGWQIQLLVQNCLDQPSRTIFSVLKRRIFALPKIVRYQNKSGLQLPMRCVNIFMKVVLATSWHRTKTWIYIEWGLDQSSGGPSIAENVERGTVGHAPSPDLLEYFQGGGGWANDQPNCMPQIIRSLENMMHLVQMSWLHCKLLKNKVPLVLIKGH